jgi:hypothetical protein
MANPLALKALRLAGKGIKKVVKKLKNQTKLQTKGISFKPKPGEGSKNYAQKLDYLVKTTPVKIGKKRAAWVKKNKMKEYPKSKRGKMMKSASDNYNMNTLKEATKILGGKGKKLKAGESTPTSRMLANSKAYGTKIWGSQYDLSKYKAGQGLTKAGQALKNKEKANLSKALHTGDLGTGVHDPNRVVRGIVNTKSKMKHGNKVWKKPSKKVLAGIVPAAGLLGDRKKK